MGSARRRAGLSLIEVLMSLSLTGLWCMMLSNTELMAAHYAFQDHWHFQIAAHQENILTHLRLNPSLSPECIIAKYQAQLESQCPHTGVTLSSEGKHHRLHYIGPHGLRGEFTRVAKADR